MKKEIVMDPNLRVRGGYGYASAMFRLHSTCKDYSRDLALPIIEKYNTDKNEFEFFSAEDFFIITLNGIPIIIKDYYFVEEKRQTAMKAYEEWVENLLIENKCY
jgi:hypothetical protein